MTTNQRSFWQENEVLDFARSTYRRLTPPLKLEDKRISLKVDELNNMDAQGLLYFISTLRFYGLQVETGRDCVWVSVPSKEGL